MPAANTQIPPNNRHALLPNLFPSCCCCISGFPCRMDATCRRILHISHKVLPRVVIIETRQHKSPPAKHALHTIPLLNLVSSPPFLAAAFRTNGFSLQTRIAYPATKKIATTTTTTRRPSGSLCVIERVGSAAFEVRKCAGRSVRLCWARSECWSRGCDD